MSGLDFIEFEETEEIFAPVYDDEDEEVEEKALSIFDILRALTETKEVLDFSKKSVKKGYNQFMINRWLSMNEFTLMFVEDINTISGLSDEQHCQILQSLIPKRKFYYDYAKRPKNLSDVDVRYIAHYFKIGPRDANNYIRVLTVEQINGILDKYRYGKNGKDMIKV